MFAVVPVVFATAAASMAGRDRTLLTAPRAASRGEEAQRTRPDRPAQVALRAVPFLARQSSALRPRSSFLRCSQAAQKAEKEKAKKSAEPAGLSRKSKSGTSAEAAPSVPATATGGQSSVSQQLPSNGPASPQPIPASPAANPAIPATSTPEPEYDGQRSLRPPPRSLIDSRRRSHRIV